jgi:class 3 adenylate cyclase
VFLVQGAGRAKAAQAEARTSGVAERPPAELGVTARAGLELVAAVGDLKTHAALQTRVGIATGLVVVGDLIGSGASQEQAIVGEMPNLAAR